MRAVSRAELLAKVYKSEAHHPEENVEKDLTEAFLTIINNYHFDGNAPIVKELLELFQIR